MFEETSQKRNGAFRDVLIIIVFGFVLLSLPNWLGEFGTVFDYPYVQAVYEFFVFLGISLLIFCFLRMHTVVYKYLIGDDNLVIRSKIGARETVVAEVHLSGACTLIPLAESGALIRERKWKERRISYGVMDRKTAYILTFPINNGDSALIFQPSPKFVEILKQILLDKRNEM